MKSPNMLHYPEVLALLLGACQGTKIMIEGLPMGSERLFKCGREGCNETATRNKAYCSAHCCKMYGWLDSSKMGQAGSALRHRKCIESEIKNGRN